MPRDDREILIDLTFKLLPIVANEVGIKQNTQSPDLAEVIAESAAYAKEIMDHVDAQLDEEPDGPDDGETIEMVPAAPARLRRRA